MTSAALLASAQGGDRAAFEAVIAPHLKGLKTHCYRMSGSWHDAEDLLQESLVRAWRGLASFRGSSSLRTWLYTVTTRACLDVLERRRVRTLPFALGPAADADEPPGAPSPETPWLEPLPGDPEDEAFGPEARLGRRESVAFAFLTLVQRLPPRQRAALLLRDVLGWTAADCAELLETSVASVNSALQRAREAVGSPAPERPAFDSEDERALLGRYVRAWELADVGALLALLKEGATLSMPPFTAWYQGVEAIGAQLRGMALPPQSAGTRRFQLTRANARPAVAVWRRDEASGEFVAEALQVLDVVDGRVEGITAFMDSRAFVALGLPERLPATTPG